MASSIHPDTYNNAYSDLDYLVLDRFLISFSQAEIDQTMTRPHLFASGPGLVLQSYPSL